MELRQIEAFVSIATLRSFRAAANRLHVTQPAISVRISSLERELNAPLFERGSNQVVELTTKGMQLLPVAEQMLDAAQRLKLQAAGDRAAYQKIRLGTTSTMANAWVAELVAEMGTALPHLTADLVVATSTKLRTMLLQGELDVGLIMGPTHAAGVRNVPLATYGTAWVSSLKMKIPRKATLARLAQHRIITHARDSATYGAIEELFRSRGLWPVAIGSTSSVGALLRVVQTGSALGFVSTACLNKDGPAFKIIDSGIETPSYQYVASYHMDSMERMGMMVAQLARKVCRAAAGRTPQTVVEK